jgi:hypothetical protein
MLFSPAFRIGEIFPIAEGRQILTTRSGVLAVSTLQADLKRLMNFSTKLDTN